MRVQDAPAVFLTLVDLGSVPVTRGAASVPGKVVRQDRDVAVDLQGRICYRAGSYTGGLLYCTNAAGELAWQVETANAMFGRPCFGADGTAYFTRQDLETRVWGEELPDSDSLRVHIHGLRAAIDKPFDKPLIQTRHGIGYRMVDPEAAVA